MSRSVRTPVSDGWTLRWVAGPPASPAAVRDREIPATVPGQVHTDLMAAGLLRDPDAGLGELDQQWIGESTWRYRGELPAIDARDHVDLVCHGIDTVAEVRLDGKLLARVADQHLGYRWPIGPADPAGAPRVLEVTFPPVLDEAARVEERTGPLPRPYEFPYPYVRKSACNFGWDWGPSYLTAGLWRPVEVHAWDVARIEAVRPLARVTGPADAPVATLDVHVDVAVAPASPAPDVRANVRVLDPNGFEVARGGGAVIMAAGGTGTALAGLAVPDPRLWHPVGLGDQPLYTVEVELVSGDGVLDSATRRTGLRTVAVDEPDSPEGRRFALIVNGRRVRVRGYNWIPDDPFVAEVTPGRIAERLDQAVAGGANLLRVWGGGYVESEEFLTGCDERGLLVWHDFPYACSAYDESDEALATARAEAEQAVASRSHHPALAVWCGGNECVWGWYDWGWPEVLAGRGYGARIYAEVLPEVVARLDPSRPYVGNSPWSGTVDVHPNDPARGPVHIWTVWNQLDFDHYRDHDPAFVSEMGWCAPPAWTTLRRAVPDGPLTLDNPVVTHHLRAHLGVENLDRGVAQNMGVPADEDDWHYLAQVVQARAMTAGAEWLRSRDRGAGVVVWQLNDCWPVISWSAVDDSGLEKPVWFGLRRSFAPRLLTLQPGVPGAAVDPATLEVVAVNDATSPWHVRGTVRRMDVDGRELASAPVDLVVAPDATARMPLAEGIGVPGDPGREFLAVDADGQRSTWFHVKDRRLALPPPAVETTVTRLDPSRVAVDVRALTLVRDLCVFPDRAAHALGLDPGSVRVDDMLLTLLPGETGRIVVSGLPDVGDRVEDVLGSRPVMRMIGDAAPAIVPDIATIGQRRT